MTPARGIPIHTHNLCFLGFGNVNRTLVRLLHDRAQELRDRHGISYRITGIASRRLGWIADPQGLDPNALSGQKLLWRGHSCPLSGRECESAASQRPRLAHRRPRRRPVRSHLPQRRNRTARRRPHPRRPRARSPRHHRQQRPHRPRLPRTPRSRHRPRQEIPLRIHRHGRHPNFFSIRSTPRDPPAGLPRHPEFHHQRNPERNGKRTHPRRRPEESARPRHRRNRRHSRHRRLGRRRKNRRLDHGPDGFGRN